MTSWWRRGPKESVLETWACERARELGGRLEKLAPTLGEKHRLDRVFLHPQRPAAYIELKRHGEPITDEQLETISGLLEHGFVAGWADDKAGVNALLERAMLPPMMMALEVWQANLDDHRRQWNEKLTKAVGFPVRRRNRGGGRVAPLQPLEQPFNGAQDDSEAGAGT